MTTPSSALLADALEVGFDGIPSLGPLDLEVRPGERLLVAGPSGSGKSTLLRLAAGAVPHVIPGDVRGSLRVFGRDATEVGIAGLARELGTVAQDPETGVCLSRVEDELAFGLENRGIPAARIGGLVGAALRRTGIERLRHRSTAALSGGELQLVALAAAIAPEPGLLLLDEPTAMLDAAGAAAVRRTLERCGNAGTAVLLVEHRLDETPATLADRVLVLGAGGRALARGGPAEVVDGRAADLLAAGCHLPSAAELRAVLGEGDPRDVARRLRALAADSHAGPAGHVRGEVLRATGLAVAPARGLEPVVRDVDLELRGGEVVALVGSNGSGKSTLLAALAGLEAPSRGRVVGPRAGMIFQNPEHQFVGGSVEAEVRAGGVDPRRATALLTELDLVSLAGRSPYRLSGGEKRRLSIAAMLGHDRPFLLADEPGFGLDRRATVAAMRAMTTAASRGVGVLFSSHDLRSVATHAHRLLVVHAGQIVESTPFAAIRGGGLLNAAGVSVPPLVARVAAVARTEPEFRAILRGLDDIAAARWAPRATAGAAA